MPKCCAFECDNKGTHRFPADEERRRHDTKPCAKKIGNLVHRLGYVALTLDLTIFMSINTKMLKGAQDQIKIVRVTSKLSHWDLRLKCNKQDNNLQEHSDLDAVLWLKSNEQNNHLKEDPDLEANMQEYIDLEVGLKLKSNEEDNHLQEYTEEGNDFEEYNEEYYETYMEESILPELHTVQQHSKVKIEINEELDSSDNLIQVKEEVLSDIDIDESENDTINFSNMKISIKEELNESQQYESTYSIFDEINKHSKKVDAITKYFKKVDIVPKHYKKVKNCLKTEKKVDDVPKSSKLVAISGTELSTLKCNVGLKTFLGDEAYNEHMEIHTTKDILPAEVIPSNSVVKVGNPISDNWMMVKVKKIRVQRAKPKTNENEATKKHFTRSSAKNIVENGVKPLCINPKQYGTRNSQRNIVDSTSTQNNNYSTIQNNNNVEFDNDSSTGKVDSNKSVKINGDSSVANDYDNDLVKVDNDSKISEDDDNSTVKENKELLIEIPGKIKVVKLPKGKRKQSKERTKRLYNHHNNVTYKVCDKSYTNKNFCTQAKEYRSEQRTKQDSNMRFACTQCGYKGYWKHHLDRHILLTHKGEKNFHCNLCDYICFRRCYLVRHMRAHSKTKTYSCDFCDYECVQRSQLNQHTTQRHAGVKPFSCKKSKKYASSYSAKNIVHSNAVIHYNNYSSVRNDNNVEVGNDNILKVDDHNDSSIIKENKDLLIEIPGKTKVVKLIKGKIKQPKERTNRLYKRHINVKYKVCDESCTDKKLCTQSKECRMKQRTKQYINSHFACSQCNYKGTQKHHLDRHMLTHNRAKNFSCSLCDYKCVQRCHLDQHMRTHSKTKPYSCTFCNYNCAQRSQLNQHMRRHTGVKPFLCNICEYTCTQRCHLDQHMRRHTGIRPFLCIHCDYKFVQQSHLNQHIMKMHENVQVYECSHCRYRCLKLNLLERHMKTH